MELKNFVILQSMILLSVSNAYRILGVFPFNAKSHFIVFEALLKTLAKQGHKVDVVSHYPQKSPVQNYKDIISFQGLLENHVNNYTVQHASKLTGDIITVVGDKFGNRLCDFMGLEKFQKLVKKPPTDPPYDLVITEAFGAHCYMGLGYVFEVPVIAVATVPEFPWISSFIGNGENLAVTPHMFHYTKQKKMDFWERLINVVSNCRYVQKFHEITDEYQTTAMRKYLKPDIPNIREVEKNVALLFVNTHPVISGIKPITSSLVQIAGLHIEANEEKLSMELKKWLDESTSGVVYFTLGSMVLIESLPTKQIQEIYASFKKISPIRVLMKVGNDSKLPTGLPKNVKTMSWIPQQPLLAHPNIKVFITHGGLGSTLEALYFGVPTIGIPVMADQFPNVDSQVKRGTSVRLDWDKISELSLSAALSEIINNPQYKKNAAYYSKLFRDNPTSQSEKAIYWVEYVIRNGGAILKSPTLQFHSYQLLLLDIYMFLTVASILVISAIIYAIKLLFKSLKKDSAPRAAKTKKIQ